MWKQSLIYGVICALVACGDADREPLEVAPEVEVEAIAARPQVATVDTAWQDRLAALSVVDPLSDLVRLAPAKEIPQVRSQYPPDRLFVHIAVDSVAQLRQLLQRLDADPADNVSAVSIPPDLGALPVTEKKNLFFNTLLPNASFHNRVIAAQRQRLQALRQRPPHEWVAEEKGFLHEMSAYYRLENYSSKLAAPGDTLNALLLRVDAIPPSLALAQAAIESGWGGSRFARQGNNLYGQRVWGKQAAGLAPKDVDNARFRLAVFPTIGASLGSYMRNLNTHPAYEDFRRERRRLRQEEKPLAGHVLATALQRYSTRGQEYVDDVLRVMRQNGLQALDASPLRTDVAAR